MGYHHIDRNFNVTALAKLTVNYPFSVIKQVLESILTTRRIIKLHYNPLTPQEVYEVSVISFKLYRVFFFSVIVS